jgi:hypothetical protein
MFQIWGGVPSINSVEIKEAVYKLLEVAFDAAEFPFTTAESNSPCI